MRAILEYLATVPGVVAWRNNTGAVVRESKGKRRMVRFGEPGMSDILGWVSWPQVITDAAHPLASNFRPMIARFLAVEVKRPGQELTDAQQRFLQSVHQAGGVAIWATSVEDVRKALGR